LFFDIEPFLGPIATRELNERQPEWRTLTGEGHFADPFDDYGVRQCISRALGIPKDEIPGDTYAEGWLIPGVRQE
jgi:hypothetical protein